MPNGSFINIRTENPVNGVSDYSYVDETVVIQGGIGDPYTVRYAVTAIWNESNLDMESGKSNTNDIVVKNPLLLKPSSLTAKESAKAVRVDSYPNPFNPRTTISYYIPEEGRLTIKILDIYGREIANLKDGIETAGNHTVDWGGFNKFGQRAASGMYFYRLIFEGKQSVGKLLLMK